MIFNRDHLIICTNNAGPNQELIGRENNIIKFVATYVLQCQNKLMATLTSYKPIIDRLDAAAQNSFGNNELRQLTNLTRKLVFFEHTMNDQTETIEAFLNDPQINTSNVEALVSKLAIQQRHLTKAIHIFRDLLDSISSLFTEMMNSSLNNLMKFLDSAGLVIATAALVSGFMGMNVGGLPWKDSHVGFWLILGFSLFLAILISIYLKRKSYR
ncbi:CorA family divalent cation transporter [Limosilactobacillus agrestimuris]|uniref:CorA family divalent cation transporter n=1 Tax=Limosilactobacillus agrestimuris TaxID=2941331 RepID=UPI0020412D6D|nr:CorA family divalent cation transporter [Limosilactobacillus agrestimuris]